jgi:DNA gyrase subunit A
VTSKTGDLVCCHVVENDDDYDLITSSNKGQIIRTSIKDISLLGRATQGVRIMRLKKEEKVAASTVF